MYNAIITKLSNVRPHSNADRLKIATCWGNQVIIGLTDNEGDWGVYFPTDGQLSEEFAKANDLIRRKDETGKQVGGMFDENRRVRTQKFRGEISDGFWCPISYLKPLFSDADVANDIVYVGGHKLPEGYEFTSINDVPICQKYVTQKTRMHGESNQGKQRARTSSKMFKEHFETDQLGKNLHKIPVDALVIITEKQHGTSGRYGHVLIDRKLNWFEKLLKRIGFRIEEDEWIYLNGTRRVIIDPNRQLYHSFDFREATIKNFKNNLHKGETVYFEVVGWEQPGKTIMPIGDNKKMNDKDFVKQYGDKTIFSYGCKEGEFDVVLYRVTLTNEDGVAYDMSWEDVKKRAKELNVSCVREIDRFIMNHRFPYSDDRTIRDEFFKYIEGLVNGPSFIDPSHIMEGICVRIESSLQSLGILKYKSYYFKVLEGHIKDSGVVDTEEAS